VGCHGGVGPGAAGPAECGFATLGRGHGGAHAAGGIGVGCAVCTAGPGQAALRQLEPGLVTPNLSLLKVGDLPWGLERSKQGF
jgi:hypothetical protein